jgi:ketosteroid isomerase-like protein
MSQENVDVVRRLDAGFLDQDWPRVLALVHPDVEMDATRSPITGLDGLHRGLEECGRFWNRWYEAWDSVTWEDPEYIDAGEKVVMWNAGQKLRGRGSGIEVELPEYGWVQTIRDRKVVQATLFMERSEALEAAGLQE